MGLIASFQHHRRTAEGRADGAVAQAEAVLAMVHARRPALAGRMLRILEIGCGQWAGMTAAFTAAGHPTVGIDLEPGPVRGAPSHWLRQCRRHGPATAGKRLLRWLVADRRFNHRLDQSCRAAFGRGVDLARLDTRTMDATRLALADHSIDLVFSQAVFEHISDVPAAAAELRRVLAPDGLALIEIHCWPSLSGGHHPDWQEPDRTPSATVPPWDHLRQRRCPVPDYCNGLKGDDYLAAFAAGFRLLERVDHREGEALLTPAIEAELAPRFSRDDLLTRGLRLLLEPA